MECKRALISGKVQGVGFRFHAYEKASRLGLKGLVRNLEDGRVEIIACGEKDDIEKFLAWASKGPPPARVEKVEITEIEKDRAFDREFYISRDGGST